MGKDKLDTVDFMSFINSMSKLDEMNVPKKKKKVKCVVKETDEKVNDEDIALNKDINDDDTTNTSDTDDDDIDINDIDVDEEDSDDDDEDSDDDDDEDEDEDEDMVDENLYNLFNNFFMDENGSSVATSMSNIAYELHYLNKNLSKMLKDKEKK
tara:strand:- start:1141 stop:1602 length:462 start_codon:yes stop_codon:yes gene_type:complete